jgi:hypothetical protein
MNILKKALVAGGCAALLMLGTNTVMAQGQGGRGGRGGFDPAQMKQRIMDDIKDQWEVKDDEWTLLEPKLGKVIDARADVMASSMRGAFGNRGGRQRGGGGTNADDNGGQPQRPRGGMFGTPSPAVEALQKAVDDKAPNAEIKAKLKAVQDELKEKQAKLTSAQEDLRGLLTPRQEAIATLRGLL